MATISRFFFKVTKDITFLLLSLLLIFLVYLCIIKFLATVIKCNGLRTSISPIPKYNASDFFWTNKYTSYFMEPILKHFYVLQINTDSSKNATIKHCKILVRTNNFSKLILFSQIAIQKGNM